MQYAKVFIAYIPSFSIALCWGFYQIPTYIKNTNHTPHLLDRLPISGEYKFSLDISFSST